MIKTAFFVTLVTVFVHKYGAHGFQAGVSDVSVHRQLARGMTLEQADQELLDFWTPERMASAQPRDIILVNSTESLMPTTRIVPQEGGIPRSVPGVPTPASAQLATTRLNTPATAGKVFFTVNGGTYVCSGSVIVSDNKDMLLTAGHCVYDTGSRQWASSIVFVPRYDRGNRPLGTWSWRTAAALTPWTNNGDFHFDVAFVLLNQLNGRHIQDVTGAFGMTVNYGKDAWVHAFGYPGNWNNGETMSWCIASSSHAHSAGGGFQGVQLPCGMGGGASGGPWLQNFNEGSGGGMQTSVNSFITNGQHMYGPYFGDDVWKLWEGHKN